MPRNNRHRSEGEGRSHGKKEGKICYAPLSESYIFGKKEVSLGLDPQPGRDVAGQGYTSPDREGRAPETVGTALSREK